MPMGGACTLLATRAEYPTCGVCAWTGRPVEAVLGTRFQELLSIGGRVYHETHLAPLLRMQGAVREIALDVVRIDAARLRDSRS